MTTPEPTDWPEKFVAALAVVGVVGRAAELAGVHRSTAYRRREADAEFKAQWDAAVEDSADVLECEAFRRARDGTDRPVFQKGELVGHVKEYSDVLLIFLLKARRPEKYRDNARVIVGGDQGGPVKVNHGGSVFDRIKELTAHYAAEDAKAGDPR